MPASSTSLPATKISYLLGAMKKRTFLKTLTMGGFGMVTTGPSASTNASQTAAAPNAGGQTQTPSAAKRPYNTRYTGEYLNRIAFPIGGLGAGMFCLEGTGALSHLSIRNHPEVYNEPPLFAALAIK